MFNFFCTGFFTSSNDLSRSAYDLLSGDSIEIESKVLKGIGWGSCWCINPFRFFLAYRVRSAVQEALAARKWDEAMALKGRVSTQPQYLTEKEKTGISRIQLAVLKSGATLQEKAAAWKSCKLEIEQLKMPTLLEEAIEFLQSPANLLTGLSEALSNSDDPLEVNIDRLPKTTLGLQASFSSCDLTPEQRKSPEYAASKQEFLKGIKELSAEAGLSDKDRIILEKLIGQPAKNRIAEQLLDAITTKFQGKLVLTINPDPPQEQVIEHLQGGWIRIHYAFNLSVIDSSTYNSRSFTATAVFDWVPSEQERVFENWVWILAE